jgi:hypothetical protein
MTVRQDKFKVGDKVRWNPELYDRDFNGRIYPHTNLDTVMEVSFVEDVKESINSVGHTQFVAIKELPYESETARQVGNIVAPSPEAIDHNTFSGLWFVKFENEDEQIEEGKFKVGDKVRWDPESYDNMSIVVNAYPHTNKDTIMEVSFVENAYGRQYVAIKELPFYNEQARELGLKHPISERARGYNTFADEWFVKADEGANKQEKPMQVKWREDKFKVGDKVRWNPDGDDFVLEAYEEKVPGSKDGVFTVTHVIDVPLETEGFINEDTEGYEDMKAFAETVGLPMPSTCNWEAMGHTQFVAVAELPFLSEEVRREALKEVGHTENMFSGDFFVAA